MNFLEICGWAGLIGVLVWFGLAVIQAAREEREESDRRARAEAEMRVAVEKEFRNSKTPKKCCGRCHKN